MPAQSEITILNNKESIFFCVFRIPKFIWDFWWVDHHWMMCVCVRTFVIDCWCSFFTLHQMHIAAKCQTKTTMTKLIHKNTFNAHDQRILVIWNRKIIISFYRIGKWFFVKFFGFVHFSVSVNSNEKQAHHRFSLYLFCSDPDTEYIIEEKYKPQIRRTWNWPFHININRSNWEMYYV